MLIKPSVLFGQPGLISTEIASAAAQSTEINALTEGGAIEGAVAYRGNVPTQTIVPTKDVQKCGDVTEHPPLIRVNADVALESASLISSMWHEKAPARGPT